MVPDRYPLPLIQELVDKVRDARLFTKMDVRAGYNNIRFREGDKEKAAFKTNMGLCYDSDTATLLFPYL